MTTWTIRMIYVDATKTKPDFILVLHYSDKTIGLLL